MNKEGIETKAPFSLVHTLRLSSFQIGSAMGDVLMTSIWNRVLITNFGIPAAPVSLLIALRYLLSPLSLWAGFRSDSKPLWGMRRTSYVWLGRALMVLSLPFLGISVMRLEGSTVDWWGWTAALLSALLYGVGTLISGSPFLALVRDSAPKARQGLAISMVETVLIIFFAIVGISFSFWMPAYDVAVFWEMIVGTMLIGGFFWLFSIWGAERRQGIPLRPSAQVALQQAGLRKSIRKIWRDRRTRGFFYFLALSTLAAWMQDAVLEPFGAELFALPLERTTRLNSYWQAATVVTLVVGAYLWRKRPPERQSRVANGGLLGMAAGIGLLAVATLINQVRLLELSLLIFGGGFGVYTFGGLSLMAVMSSDREAGAYLGLWTISIVLFKGIGTFVGGALRDLLLLSIQFSPTVTYALIFFLQAGGLVTAVFILHKVDVISFAREMGRLVKREEAQIAVAD